MRFFSLFIPILAICWPECCFSAWKLVILSVKSPDAVSMIYRYIHSTINSFPYTLEHFYDNLFSSSWAEWVAGNRAVFGQKMFCWFCCTPNYAGRYVEKEELISYQYTIKMSIAKQITDLFAIQRQPTIEIGSRYICCLSRGTKQNKAGWGQ